MKNSEFGWSKYNRPTPRRMRKLGDSLLVLSTTITTYAITEELKTLALASILIGAGAKFITSFFSKD